jgi:hypothetical protein
MERIENFKKIRAENSILELKWLDWRIAVCTERILIENIFSRGNLLEIHIVDIHLKNEYSIIV